MRSIIFKSIYMDLIRQGKKTQTVRMWKSIPNNAIPGTIFTATNYRESIKLKLISCTQKHVFKLTELDAKADGFESKKELNLVIQNLYGTLNFKATIIKFELFN